LRTPGVYTPGDGTNIAAPMDVQRFDPGDKADRLTGSKFPS